MFGGPAPENSCLDPYRSIRWLINALCSLVKPPSLQWCSPTKCLLAADVWIDHGLQTNVNVVQYKQYSLHMMDLTAVLP